MESPLEVFTCLMVGTGISTGVQPEPLLCSLDFLQHGGLIPRGSGRCCVAFYDLASEVTKHRNPARFKRREH